MQDVRKRDVKDDAKALGLSKQIGGVINRDGNAAGRASFQGRDEELYLAILSLRRLLGI